MEIGDTKNVDIRSPFHFDIFKLISIYDTVYFPFLNLYLNEVLDYLLQF